jgi:hypothetical protein
MTTDWMATLKEAGTLVQKTEADTLKLLQNDQLDVSQAVRLLDAVNELSDQFDDVIAEMYADEGVDEELLEAAVSIEALWSELCMRCVDKVRSLQQGIE